MNVKAKLVLTEQDKAETRKKLNQLHGFETNSTTNMKRAADAALSSSGNNPETR